MKLKALMAASAAVMFIGGSASASMVYNIIEQDYLPSNNAFESDYAAEFGGIDNVGFGLVQSAEIDEDSTIAFKAEWEESGFDNGFEFTFAGVAPFAFTEPLVVNGVVDSAVVDVDGGQFFSGSDMQFFSLNDGGVDAGLGDTGFGIFYDLRTDGRSDTVFLAYADRNADRDSDYDDLVVETTGDINVVPLPAAGWMLLAGLGGMAALRRRQKS